MTDLPSWALEKGRHLAGAFYGIPFDQEDEFLAKALHHAYQQGKQDGQREMKERAEAKTREMLVYADTSTMQDDAICAAIRRLDGVQDDA